MQLEGCEGTETLNNILQEMFYLMLKERNE